MREKNLKVTELRSWEHSLGKHGFTMAMKAFGNMTNEKLRQVVNGFKNLRHKKGKVFHEYCVERERLCSSREESGPV